MRVGFLIAGALLLCAFFILAYAIVNGGFGDVSKIRGIAEFYLERCRPAKGSFSPEAVTSVVWDYRGFDTLFETLVFFLAIIGSIALLEGESRERILPGKMTLIVRLVTKILVVAVVAVSASIALHGHLTPGGGFQAGAAIAVVPLMVLVAFEPFAFRQRGITKKTAVSLRIVGLLGIAFVAFLPAFLGRFFMQNMGVFPPFAFGMLVSGSLIYYNIFEYLAVGMGFLAVFLLLFGEG